jgi:hypothetical protein
MMSKHGVVLPLTPDYVEAWQARWDAFARHAPYPRASWLSALEADLATLYPGASSRDRNVTARSIAPFYLAQHP